MVSTASEGRQPVQGERLTDRFNPRRNNFDGLRLALALLVVIDHGTVMRTGAHHLWGRSALGDFAVDGFFILSGLLITRSYLKLSSFPRFTWHRALRIMPGFLVCLVVTALVVAPLAAVLSGRTASSAFTESPTAWRYVLVNAGLLINQYDVAGLLADNPNPLVFNGALWTLSLEALCYGLVGLLGVVAILRPGPLGRPGARCDPVGSHPPPGGGRTGAARGRHAAPGRGFLVGASAWLYTDTIPMKGWLAVLAVAVMLVSILTLDNYRLVGIVPAAYVLIWLGTCLPWNRSLSRDLSYGVYIYTGRCFSCSPRPAWSGWEFPCPCWWVQGSPASSPWLPDTSSNIPRYAIRTVRSPGSPARNVRTRTSRSTLGRAPPQPVGTETRGLPGTRLSPDQESLPVRQPRCGTIITSSDDHVRL